MNNINFDDKLYNILNENEKLLEFFINNGFEKLKDKKMLSTMGKLISLNMALKVRGINKDAFREKLLLFLNSDKSDVDSSLKEDCKEIHGDVIVKGILPCPVKLPLLDAFEKFSENTKNFTIGYDLRSASMGVDFLKDEFLKDEKDLSDVFLSAGFELFFDKKYMGKYIDKDIFHIDIKNMNEDFKSYGNLFVDNKKIYHILSVVPCVFLVNENNLEGKKAPSSFEELLFSGNFTDSTALPLNDLDMFNALVLNIYKKWGLDGIYALAKIYKKSLHPSEMVKKKGDEKYNPKISITPLFFTQMVSKSSCFKTIWPKDGAIVSPIFLVAKKNKKYVKEILDFFTNQSTGEILSSNGKFPTSIFGVNNNLQKENKFMFCGFDFLYNNDIGTLFKNLEDIFNREILK